MRGEHDLSEYCLQDDGSSSSQLDSDTKHNTTRDGEKESLSLAWADEQQGVLPADSHGNGVRDDRDDAFGVSSWGQGSGEHAPATAATAAGAANSAKGVGRWRSDEEEKARDIREEGRGGGNGRDVEGNQEGIGGGSVYFEDECQRQVSSLGPAAEVPRQKVDSAGRVESNISGCSPSKRETNNDADSNNVNAHANTGNSSGFSPSHERPTVAAEGTTRTEGEGGAASSHTQTSVFSPSPSSSSTTTNNRPVQSSNKEYARGSSTFFPATDDDDDDDVDDGGGGGGPRQTRSNPSPATPTAAKATRKGHLSGYGDDRGMHNRRRPSGVSEGMLTAGARAPSETASATVTPSAVEKPQAPSGHQSVGEALFLSDDFAPAREGGGGEGGQHRLGPDEATPTVSSAYAASTAAICTGHRRRQGGWPQTVLVEGERTPRLYAGSRETPSPAAVIGVDERARSPGDVEGRFGSESPRCPALSLCSTEELSGGGVTERKQMRSGRCASGYLLKSCTPYGYGTPRHKATVADVQEAFERADIRVAREAVQSPRSDHGEGGAQQNRQIRGGGDVGGGQGFKDKVIGRVAGLSDGQRCINEVSPVGVSFPVRQRQWIRCFAVCRVWPREVDRSVPGESSLLLKQIINHLIRETNIIGSLGSHVAASPRAVHDGVLEGHLVVSACRERAFGWKLVVQVACVHPRGRVCLEESHVCFI